MDELARFKIIPTTLALIAEEILFSGSIQIQNGESPMLKRLQRKAGTASRKLQKLCENLAHVAVNLPQRQQRQQRQQK